MVRVEYDYAKLRGRIVEKFGSVRSFAEKINVANSTICAKLKGKKTITKADVITWSHYLDIEIDDIGVYFFTPKKELLCCSESLPT